MCPLYEVTQYDQFDNEVYSRTYDSWFWAKFVSWLVSGKGAYGAPIVYHTKMERIR